MNTSFGGKNTGNVVCEAADRDGDKRLSSFSIASVGKVTRESIAGHGKYDGMSSTTAVALLGPRPTVKEGTFQDRSHQTGTYELK
jgi:hypothetical protein